MDKKKKIVFVVPEITAGGAERVMTFLAQNLSKSHFDVSLWAAGYEKNTVYNIDGINVKYFNRPRVLTATPSFFFALLKNRPNIVVSSISHLNTVMGLLSIFFPKTKFIGREANVLSVQAKFYKKRTGILGKIPLTKIGYKFLDIILCQSKDMYNDMKANQDIPPNKMRIINNPITDAFILKTPNEEKNDVVKFITVARLKKQKGHERIIRAISKLNFPYQYTIIGDGTEKDNLFNLIEELGIKKNIIHIPYTNEVPRYLAESDFFLQGAYVEGFPNCLLESCSIGTPVIAYRAPGGLNEIMEDGVNGLVADSQEEYIQNIIKAATELEWDPKEVNYSVFKKFNKEIILNKYEELFLELV
ncbi:glycosyltransferase [Flavivirga spongiicola]|uniref:Glycosyltransferase n=1 Tax=Flavivirga spongiicola TaxID=421621 RepID=A0ABU7Y032_9FLAO|nr:glycosyltransferase [Flavivirga sp. MEBiC05379]MDO5980479.1 glycosyltransferase [Flavivirga sp. MEBiC05379]